MKLIFLVVTVGFLTVVNGDCWWTGCQLHTWAVVGCGNYGRVQMGRQDCSGGYMYNCCSSDSAGGRVTGGSNSIQTSQNCNCKSGGNSGGNSQQDSVGKYAYCWWTGCQLSTWAVVGCDHYKMKTINMEPCPGGNKYHCCPL